MASKVDPSVYALSVQLSLDSMTASASLDQFSDKLVDLEKQVSDSATQALGSISKSIDFVNTSLAKMVTQLGSINDTSSDIGVELTKQFKTTTDINEIDEKEIKRQEKALKIQKEQFELHDDLIKACEHMQELNKTFIKDVDKISQGVKRKNKGHQEQIELLKTDNMLIGMFGKAMGLTVDETKAVENVWKGIKKEIEKAWNLVVEYAQDSEAFVVSTYRMYASQEDLVASARHLNAEWGVGRKEAIAAYAALGNLQTPIDQLDSLAASVAKANRFTGVSVEVLAQFSAKVRAAGGNAKDFERQMVWMGEAMRKFGLSSADAAKIVGDVSISGARLKLLFGGSETAVEGVNKIKAALMGLNKSLGQSTDVANNFVNKLSSDFQARMMFSGLTGVMIKNEEDLAKAIGRSGMALKQQGASLEKLNALDPAAAMKQQEIWANLFTGGDQEALLMLMTLQDKMDKGLIGQINTVEDLTKALAILKDEQMDPYSKANYTFAAQLRILKNRFESLVGSITALIERALKPVLYVINVLIDVIVGVADWIQKWTNVLKAIIPGFSEFVDVIEWLGGAVLALVFGVGALVGVIGGLLLFLVKFPVLISRITLVVQALSDGIIALAEAVGKSIAAILGGIGKGLAALGGAVKGVLPQLLGLGVALLLVAASAWVFTQAVKTMVEIGPAAEGVIRGFISALILFGLILIGLGILAEVASVGLIILGAVILAIGVGAALMGAGLWLAGEGIALMAAPLTWELLGKMALLALVVVALGAAGITAFGGLLLLGVGLAVIAGAAMLGALALDMIVTSMNKINAEDLVVKATSILIAGTILAIAAVAIGVAAIGIGLASAGLIIGLAMFAVAAAIMIAAGVIFVIGAYSISAGASVLAPAAALLKPAGADIMAAGADLLIGAIALGIAAAIMALAGIAIGAASLPLVGGVILFAVAAVALAFAGKRFIGGARDVSIGAKLLVPAMAGLKSASSDLKTAGADLLLGAATMAIALIAIAAVGIEMAIVGAAFLIAAAVLTAAMWVLSEGTSLAAKAGDQLRTGGEQLVVGMQSILTAVGLMSEIGIRFGLRIARFVTAMKLLEPVGFSVLSAGSALMIGGMALLQGATSINSAIDLMSKVSQTVPDLTKLTDSLNTAAEPLQKAVTKFRKPADELIAVLNNLNSSISDFGKGINLADDVGGLAVKLEEYATLLESTTARIETALLTRAIPAMKAAERAGLKDAIRSEAITTVQVLDKREGGDAGDKSIALLEEQNRLIQLVIDAINNKSIDGGDLDEITTLLQTWLPALDKSGGSLSSSLNNW